MSNLLLLALFFALIAYIVKNWDVDNIPDDYVSDALY